MEQERSLKALQSRLDAAEAELQRGAELQKARLALLHMEYELCRDRRSKEALEWAIEVLGDCSDAHLAPASPGVAEGNNPVLYGNCTAHICTTSVMLR